jgi:ribosomal 50S subunit-recycling heat shock protein
MLIWTRRRAKLAHRRSIAHKLIRRLMKKVKVTHSVDYKGTGIKAGAEVELEDAIADNLIAAGHAVEVAEKEKASKKSER